MTKKKNFGSKLKSVITFVAIVFLGTAAADVLVPEASNIPSPSVSSVFYFVAPTARSGISSVSCAMKGISTEKQTRTYGCAFETRLTSCPPGLLLIIQ